MASVPTATASGSVPPRFATLRRLRLIASPTDMFLIGEVVRRESSAAEAPTYRVLQFDRSVAVPTSLPEIMLEHKSAYDSFAMNSLVEGLYARMNLPIPTTPFFEASSGGNGSPAGGSSSTPSESAASSSSAGGGGGGGGNFSSPSGDSLVTLDIAALLGVVQFTKGYYLVVVTRAEEIGRIAGHGVFGIKSAELVPISHEPSTSPAGAVKSTWQWLQERVTAADPAAVVEGRYQSLFLNMDLTRDFFFSYDYDVTRTLQQQVVERVEVRAEAPSGMPTPSPSPVVSPPAEPGSRSGAPLPPAASTPPSPAPAPLDHFHWNGFLTAEMMAPPCSVHASWFPPLAYGYFRQLTLSLFGRPLLLSLVARRSRHFAGTRYLKRGASSDGHVANEVESEQIVDDGEGHFASFTQVRGSVPVYWMQRANLAIPKPPILLQPRDLTYGTARRHVGRLLGRYGSPLLALNLVKKKERGAREKLIGREFGRVAASLNKQLPAAHRLQYLTLDYSTLVKSKGHNVLAALRDAGRWTAANVGFFCNAVLAQSLRVKRGGGGGGGGPRRMLRLLPPQRQQVPSSAPTRRRLLALTDGVEEGASASAYAPASTLDQGDDASGEGEEASASAATAASFSGAETRVDEADALRTAPVASLRRAAGRRSSSRNPFRLPQRVYLAGVAVPSGGTASFPPSSPATSSASNSALIAAVLAASGAVRGGWQQLNTLADSSASARALRGRDTSAVPARPLLPLADDETVAPAPPSSASPPPLTARDLRGDHASPPLLLASPTEATAPGSALSGGAATAAGGGDASPSRSSAAIKLAGVAASSGRAGSGANAQPRWQQPHQQSQPSGSPAQSASAPAAGRGGWTRSGTTGSTGSPFGPGEAAIKSAMQVFFASSGDPAAAASPIF